MLMDNKVINEKLSAAYKIQGPIAGAGYEGVITDLTNSHTVCAVVNALVLFLGICRVVLIE